jgi:hypothetical protein
MGEYVEKYFTEDKDKLPYKYRKQNTKLLKEKGLLVNGKKEGE